MKRLLTTLLFLSVLSIGYSQLTFPNLEKNGKKAFEWVDLEKWSITAQDLPSACVVKQNFYCNKYDNTEVEVFVPVVTKTRTMALTIKAYITDDYVDWIYEVTLHVPNLDSAERHKFQFLELIGEEYDGNSFGYLFDITKQIIGGYSNNQTILSFVLWRMNNGYVAECRGDRPLLGFSYDPDKYDRKKLAVVYDKIDKMMYGNR